MMRPSPLVFELVGDSAPDGDLATARTERRRPQQPSIVSNLMGSPPYPALTGSLKPRPALCDKGSSQPVAYPPVQANLLVLKALERVLERRPVPQPLSARPMAHSATLRGLTDKERKPVDKAVKYLTKRKYMMPYGQLLAADTPIASGVIEGACRHLICDHLEKAGARWTLDRAEVVMQLRALEANGDVDNYWQHYEACERQRNHDLRYAHAKPPEVRNAIPGRHLREVQ